MEEFRHEEPFERRLTTNPSPLCVIARTGEGKQLLHITLQLPLSRQESGRLPAYRTEVLLK